MQSIYDKYSSIISFIRKSTKDADEVEQMEKYKYDLASD